MSFETTLDNDIKDHFDGKKMFRISLALIAENRKRKLMIFWRSTNLREKNPTLNRKRR